MKGQKLFKLLSVLNFDKAQPQVLPWRPFKVVDANEDLEATNDVEANAQCVRIPIFGSSKCQIFLALTGSKMVILVKFGLF